MTDLTHAKLSVHPYDTDLLDVAAKQIIKDNRQKLPDLSHCIVILPNYHVASATRRAILQHASAAGYNTVLGPKIYLLKDYILKNTLLDHSQLSAIASELLIINSLNENKNLFGSNNTLTSSYALLDLVNLLTRHQVVLPANIHSFKQQLINAYNTQAKEFEALSREAQIIFSIWQAWHVQLAELQQIDKETLYQLKLGKSARQTNNSHFYMVGNQNFLPSEINWLEEKLKSGQLNLFLQSGLENPQLHPDAFAQQTLDNLHYSAIAKQTNSDRSRFYSLVFNSPADSLKNRIEQAKKFYPISPIKEHVSIFQGHTFEEEALAIQLQVQIWLGQGKSNIALVLEDRKLARRVRALLERHGIGVCDSEGWALSTSNAASIVESLLEAIEENFNHIALLNLMKSPFVFPQDDAHSHATARLEQEILQREKIYSDLERYKRAIKSRQRRLNIDTDKTNITLFEMLDKLQQSSNTLYKSYLSGESKVSVFTHAIIKTLKKLGIYEKFEQDVAGQAIIDLLENIVDAANSCDISLSWIELRQWFAKKMEEHTFTVTSDFKTQIQLLHLHQTNLTKHEAIIIGNVVRESFPGPVKKTPFFNQQVYQELGLPGAHQELEEKFFYFRRLLDSADNILLSYHHGEQETQASPWLELLQNFHRLSFNEELSDHTLENLVQARQILSKSSTRTIEAERISINGTLLPQKISASAHQTLINCPYAYHLAEVLKLRAPEEIRQTLAKNDYGERVHYILFLFHQGKDNDFPPPFKERITQQNKEQAIFRLNEISQAVFQLDLEDNFQHRGWYKRWINTIPKYIDWLMQDQIQWNFDSGEINAANKLTNEILAYGRIDRIDKCDDKKRIIDYKTGAFAKQAEVESGEAVQLTHYALACADSVVELGYLALENKAKNLKAEILLDEENLLATKQAAEKRLQLIKQQIETGSSLTAWGDEQTCGYCQFDGICRSRIE